MKISDLYDAVSAQNRRISSQEGSAASFRDILAQAQNAASQSSATNVSSSDGSSTDSGTDSSSMAAINAALIDYLSKSPIEHMREAIMKEMGITQDQLDAMPADKRQSVEEEIGRRIKERLLGQEQKTTEPVALPVANTANAASTTSTTNTNPAGTAASALTDI